MRAAPALLLLLHQLSPQHAAAESCANASSGGGSDSDCVEPACVRIGGLFPKFKTAAHNFKLDTSGIRRLSSFYMAINEINNKSDGVADKLLPHTELRFAVRDSKRDDSSAFFGALELTREVFGGAGVKAIVGAASSGPSKAAALVTARAQVPGRARVTGRATVTETKETAVWSSRSDQT